MTSSITQHLSAVLDKDRINILPFLEPFRARGFYLAWGTALALIFGHRESEDFDFFMNADFDTEELFSFCQSHFSNRHIEKILESENTLWITVDNIKLSFFTLKSPILEPYIETPYFDIASIRDIGTMKLWAIQHRATQKDYIDLVYIIRAIWIVSLLKSFEEKYGNIIAESLLLKSLIYFDDVNNVGIKMLTENYDWKEIRSELEKVVKKYMKS